METKQLAKLEKVIFKMTHAHEDEYVDPLDYDEWDEWDNCDPDCEL